MTKVEKKNNFLKLKNLIKEMNCKFYEGPDLSFISFLFCKFSSFFQYKPQYETLIENVACFSIGKMYTIL